MMRLALLATALLLAACTSTSIEPAALPEPIDPGSTSTSSPATTTTTTRPASTTTTMPASESRPVSPLAELVEPAGSAIPAAAEQDAPVPASLSLESIDIEDAPIIPVGVLDDGQMEIPGRTEIGWYRFGPSPGSDGSAVLAAHIAFDNRGGVFRHLSRVELEDVVTVTFDDGSTQDYEVFELAQYGKTELPFDRVFAKNGEPVVVLITCGGAFDRSAGSYEDNIVVYARPPGRV